jgi:molybdopterin/thiamine biosynthesis adenylyltransferase
VYHRQQLITGWDQERLAHARVAIVGSDWRAGYCALYLACLGVGRIYLLDNARAKRDERFFFPLKRGDSRAQGWADWLVQLGFTNHIIARHTNPIYGGRVILPPVDAIISATNDAASQQALARYAVEQCIPLLIGTTAGPAGSFMVITEPTSNNVPFKSEIRNPKLSAAAKSELSSAVIAALMVEELRRFLLPLPDDCPLPSGHALHYNPSHPHRFAPSNGHFPISQFPNFPISRVLLVGAGALGTFAALSLTRRGDIDSLTIVDPDYIEVTNLNRQPLYLHAVGDGKALTLAKQLRKIQPAMQVDYIAEPVSAEHFDRCSPDLVLSCVDSFAPRKLLHDECLRRSIPLINGGTSAFSGHLEVYHPGKTACFNCLYALDALVAREAEERADPARCQRAVEASIVTTNALIGGLMAAEVGNLHNPPRFMLHYDTRAPQRITCGFAYRPCSCSGRSENIFLSVKK